MEDSERIRITEVNQSYCLLSLQTFLLAYLNILHKHHPLHGFENSGLTVKASLHSSQHEENLPDEVKDIKWGSKTNSFRGS